MVDLAKKKKKLQESQSFETEGTGSTALPQNSNLDINSFKKLPITFSVSDSFMHIYCLLTEARHRLSSFLLLKSMSSSVYTHQIEYSPVPY